MIKILSMVSPRKAIAVLIVSQLIAAYVGNFSSGYRDGRTVLGGGITCTRTSSTFGGIPFGREICRRRDGRDIGGAIGGPGGAISGEIGGPGGAISGEIGGEIGGVGGRCRGQSFIDAAFGPSLLTCGRGQTFPGLIWGDCPISACILKIRRSPNALGGPLDF